MLSFKEFCNEQNVNKKNFENLKSFMTKEGATSFEVQNGILTICFKDNKSAIKAFRLSQLSYNEIGAYGEAQAADSKITVELSKEAANVLNEEADIIKLKDIIDDIVKNGDNNYEQWKGFEENNLNNIKKAMSNLSLKSKIEVVDMLISYDIIPTEYSESSTRGIHERYNILESIFTEEELLEGSFEDYFKMPDKYFDKKESNSIIQVIIDFKDFKTIESKASDLNKEELYDCIVKIGNKYKSNIELFVELLSILGKKYDAGHPFRQYGYEKVQEILDEISVEDELIDEIVDTYYFKKFDIEGNYKNNNASKNKAEAEHISKQGKNYRHD